MKQRFHMIVDEVHPLPLITLAILFTNSADRYYSIIKTHNGNSKYLAMTDLKDFIAMLDYIEEYQN